MLEAWSSVEDSEEGRTCGQSFYRCSFWLENGCGVFQLRDVLTESEDLENKIFKEKIKNLKMKNEKLKIVVVELNSEIRKYRKREKLVLYALLASWVVFVFCCMCRTSV
ncbi:hypothetical protein KSS87_015095 [Heliosperma pusillum]|nr:hypothetical protein KSS87_003042 [Heliosperma pusillum]KAH9615674.1 hypothetical protein KSS87_015095 [Heliosperma pusillum]